MKHLSHEQFSALKAAERKMLWRVLLLNVLLMFVNYIDRTNLSFAAVQLNRDIGLDHQTYGLGAGTWLPCIEHRPLRLPCAWRHKTSSSQTAYRPSCLSTAGGWCMLPVVASGGT
jgi:hypothetical protein